MDRFSTATPSTPVTVANRSLTLSETLVLALGQWRLLVVLPLFAGALAVSMSFLVRPIYTSEALLLPPAPQASSLSALGGMLGGGASALVGGGLSAALKDPSDQWIAILRSRTVADVLVDRFDLVERYDVKHRFQAREALADATRIETNRQGLIVLRVEDTEPAKARAMAQAYVDELQRLGNNLAVSAAAKRRVFFERQFEEASSRLTSAEAALRGVVVRDDSIRAHPQATLEAIGELRRGVLALEVQLSGLRSVMADGSPQIAQVQARLDQLRRRLQEVQGTRGPAGPDPSGGEDYLAKYRAFKYAEAIFESLARQLELARIEEAREGALVQLVDEPSLPEWKTRPKRAFIGIFTALAVALLALVYVVVRTRLGAWLSTEEGARIWPMLRSSLRRRRATGGA